LPRPCSRGKQLEAIKQTKVNMTVWLGDYNVATDNRAAYTRQRDAITAALTTYGTDHVGGGAPSPAAPRLPG
jgi:hypothetical protein